MGAGKHGRRGFTLLEFLFVLVLMGLFTTSLATAKFTANNRTWTDEMGDCLRRALYFCRKDSVVTEKPTTMELGRAPWRFILIRKDIDGREVAREVKFPDGVVDAELLTAKGLAIRNNFAQKPLGKVHCRDGFCAPFTLKVRFREERKTIQASINVDEFSTFRLGL
jgi:prepilin-type N-terminal cleavage/methylation domain-containing protein